MPQAIRRPRFRGAFFIWKAGSGQPPATVRQYALSFRRPCDAVVARLVGRHAVDIHHVLARGSLHRCPHPHPDSRSGLSPCGVSKRYGVADPHGIGLCLRIGHWPRGEVNPHGRPEPGKINIARRLAVFLDEVEVFGVELNNLSYGGRHFPVEGPRLLLVRPIAFRHAEQDKAQHGEVQDFLPQWRRLFHIGCAVSVSDHAAALGAGLRVKGYFLFAVWALECRHWFPLLCVCASLT